MKLYVNTRATYAAMTKYDTAASQVVAVFEKEGYSLEEAHAAATEWAALSSSNGDSDSYTVSDSGRVSFVSSHPEYQKMVSRRRTVLNLLKGLPARGKAKKKGEREEVDLVAENAEWFIELGKKDQNRFLKLTSLIWSA